MLGDLDLLEDEVQVTGGHREPLAGWSRGGLRRVGLSHRRPDDGRQGGREEQEQHERWTPPAGGCELEGVAPATPRWGRTGGEDGAHLVSGGACGRCCGRNPTPSPTRCAGI